MNSSQNAFAWLAQTVVTHPRRVLIGLFVCTLFSILSALQLRVDSNIIKLLPSEEPATKELLQINEREGGTHFLNISLRGGSFSKRQEKIRFVADEIQKQSDIEYVLYDLSQIDPQVQKQLMLMQLSEKEVQQLDVRLKQAIALGPSMMSPMIASSLFDLGALSAKIIQQKNIDSGEMCLSKIRDSNAVCDDLSQLIIRPRGSPFDNEFSVPLMASIDDIIERANLSEHDIEVAWIGGAYRHAVDDVNVVVYDVSRTAILSLCLVLVLISLMYREKRALLIIFVPLLIGNIWTWGYTYWMIGELNTFTSFSSAILLGLGVDFAIHLYSRYQEERENFSTPQEAIVETWRKVGPPCGAAALTSAGGFVALRFGNFMGFQQLGVILCGGILLCLLAVLIMLPLMVLWREGLQKPVVVHNIEKEQIPKGISYNSSGIFLSLLIIAALLCLTQIQNVKIDYDLSNLRKEGDAYSELSTEERLLADANFPPVLIEFESEEELARAHALFESVLEQEGYFNGVLSIHSIFPFAQDKYIHHIQGIVDSINAENSKYLPKKIQENLSPLRSLEPKRLTKVDLPSSISQLVGASSNRHRLLLFPQGNMWDVQQNNKLATAISPYIQRTGSLGLEAHQLKEKIDAPLKNTTVIGEYIARSALFRLIKDDAPRIGFLAFFMIFILSFVDIRSLWRSISAVFVLAMGLSFTCAAFVWCGLKLSMISFVGIPILMGIGIDIIIHLMHRIDEEGKGRINVALRTTGKAAVFSALTTMVSFSSLLIASNRGIQSLGVMTVLGLLLIVLCAFTVVPLGWMVLWNRDRTKKESD